MTTKKNYSLLLILPRIQRGQSSVKNEQGKLSPPPLSLPYIASLTPKNFEVSIVDENVNDIDFEKSVDIVGISVMTMAAPRAYQIAHQFKGQGKTVVLGGIHPSMLPKEASKHADAIVIGEAEGIWQKLLMDFQRGKMEEIYKRGNLCNLKGLPYPRWELTKKDDYFMVNMVQSTRGCPYNCSFCSIPSVFGHKYRCRPVEDVINEIKISKRKLLCFADADTFGNTHFAKKLLTALIPYKKIWATDAGIKIAKNDELLRLAAKSGCKALFIGFESLSQKSLIEAGKNQNVINQYKDAINKLHQHGISVFGGFIFGFDSDDDSVFEQTIKFVIESKMDFADFNILYPYPGTNLFDKLKKEDRIIEKDWSKYYGNNVVFQPKQMSVETLRNGTIWAWKEFYSSNSIIKRFFSLQNFTYLINPIAYLLLNIGTKRIISRL